MEQKQGIAGKYKHYKGKEYVVYCEAVDIYKNKYVLYQQCYDDKSFWVRPYEMFFETVQVDGETKKRFTFKGRRRAKTEDKIKELIDLIKSQHIQIRHTETGQYYVITNIAQELEYVNIHKENDDIQSGYLSEYELSKRMGFYSCRIDNNINFFEMKDKLDSRFSLEIGNNDMNELSTLFNPCSIDLKIASSGFLVTKRKLVDPQSVEHISSESDLWKPVKKYTSKNLGPDYIKIRPGATILTHTKDCIKIPDDCAGKIEIKSTFARLSLSVTFGDFCNPGYKGYFPLEIKNNGKHTIIIHENETMAQLILIPLQGAILNEYSSNATYVNEKGYDDGTPYSFWRERSIKALRVKTGNDDIIKLYHNILYKIKSDNTPDVNEYKERFNNSFLPFCQKCIIKPKYRQMVNDKKIDKKKIIGAYVRKEKFLKSLCNIKWGSGVGSIICVILPFILQYVQNSSESDNSVSFLNYWFLLMAAIILLIVTIALFVWTSSKVFCTFEKIDLEDVMTD